MLKLLFLQFLPTAGGNTKDQSIASMSCLLLLMMIMEQSNAPTSIFILASSPRQTLPTVANLQRNLTIDFQPLTSKLLRYQ